MNSESQIICYLCFKVVGNNYRIIEGVTKELLIVFLLKMNLKLCKNALICQCCAEKIKKSLSFKLVFLETEKHILSFALEKHERKFDLRDIIEKNASVTVDEDFCICRFCATQLGRSNFVSLNSLFLNNAITFKEAIPLFLPEMDFNIIKNPVICTFCRGNLEFYFKFFNNCLDMKNKIKTNCQSISNVGQVKLNNIQGNTVYNNTVEQDNVHHEEFTDAIKVQELNFNYEEVMSNSESPVELIIMNKNKQKGKYKCPICFYETKYRKCPKKHALTHENSSEEKLYKYALCLYEANDNSSFKSHELNLKKISALESYNLPTKTMKVSDIKNLTFNLLNINEKLSIKNSGRPTPVLNIVQEQRQCYTKPAFKRKFNKNIYNKTTWICGCEETNSFYCFICLLFGGDRNWTKSGVNDLKNISLKIKKHENSATHRNSLVSFQVLGKTNIATSLSKVIADDIREHNNTVTKNLEVLLKIIDILKLCGTCNLPVCGYDEEKDTSNKGVFLELVDFLATADCAFKSHIQDATKGASMAIQHEILQCMLEVCREHILQEIEQSLYFAVMAEDVTDVSTQTQTVIVVRYELRGKIFERFWGFASPDSQDSNGLYQCILEQISPILKDCPEKLIGQTYGGAPIMRGLNVKIQEQYKNAHFVYCYAHKLDKIIEQSISNIATVRIFFLNLNGISAFFSKSPGRIAAIQNVSVLISSSSPTCTLQSVYNNKDDIIKCFENIILGIPKRYNAETVTQATGFIKWLEDDTFLFWLNFFSNVLPHVDVLFSQLNEFETDIVKIQQCIDRFEKEIIQIKNNLPRITDEIESTEVPSKRRRFNEEHVNISVREVCDIISWEVRNRFSFKNHLCGARLFLKPNYEEYNKKLPISDIETFCAAYPMIDKEILKMELGVFYFRKEITEHYELNETGKSSGCLQMLNFIMSLGLDIAFKEIVKVLKILVTIPMSTSETGRCFSTLKSIKSFLSAVCDEEDKLTALGMLSMETSMVRDIPKFNEKVIEKFISDKDRRMEFHYKK